MSYDRDPDVLERIRILETRDIEKDARIKEQDNKIQGQDLTMKQNTKNQQSVKILFRINKFYFWAQHSLVGYLQDITQPNYIIHPIKGHQFDDSQ
ncbi:hypothetical protein pb186bvf_017465 [Paramecium bursaria]